MINPILEFLRPPANAGHPRRPWSSPASACSRCKQIPIDAFPDVTNVQVQVLATAGGMSPPEVEKLVTRPIEIEMAGLPRLEEMRSVSKIGLCAITIVFEDGVNDYFARQLVFERLQGVRDNLPAGVDVQLGPITTGLGRDFSIHARQQGPEIRRDRAAHDPGLHRPADPAHRARVSPT